MYFTAIANNGQRKVKENLDNFNELQEFMNKMEKRGFLNVEVSSENKVIVYNHTGEEWESISTMTK